MRVQSLLDAIRSDFWWRLKPLASISLGELIGLTILTSLSISVPPSPYPSPRRNHLASSAFAFLTTCFKREPFMQQRDRPFLSCCPSPEYVSWYLYLVFSRVKLFLSPGNTLAPATPYGFPGAWNRLFWSDLDKERVATWIYNQSLWLTYLYKAMSRFGLPIINSARGFNTGGASP
jgi:hypothetical protein